MEIILTLPANILSGIINKLSTILINTKPRMSIKSLMLHSKHLSKRIQISGSQKTMITSRLNQINWKTSFTQISKIFLKETNDTFIYILHISFSLQSTFFYLIIKLIFLFIFISIILWNIFYFISNFIILNVFLILYLVQRLFKHFILIIISIRANSIIVYIYILFYIKNIRKIRKIIKIFDSILNKNLYYFFNFLFLLLYSYY
jgi:hypothetical protein